MRQVFTVSHELELQKKQTFFPWCYTTDLKATKLPRQECFLLLNSTSLYSGNLIWRLKGRQAGETFHDQAPAEATHSPGRKPLPLHSTQLHGWQPKTSLCHPGMLRRLFKKHNWNHPSNVRSQFCLALKNFKKNLKKIVALTVFNIRIPKPQTLSKTTFQMETEQK